MNLKERIGKNIGIYRKKSGFKQSDIAEKVGVSTKHQSRIENGAHFPSADLLEKYAKEFNVDVSLLLDIKDVDISINLKEKIFDLVEKADDNQTKILYNIVSSIVK